MDNPHEAIAGLVAAATAAAAQAGDEYSGPAPLGEEEATSASPAAAGSGAVLALLSGGEELDVRCALLPLTDLGNAQRFIARHGANFCYVEQWGWLAWDGRRWNNQDADAILTVAVHDTIKSIAEEAHQIRLLQLIWFGDVATHAEYKAGDNVIDPIVDVKKDRLIRFSDRISGWCVASQSNAHLSCVATLAKAYLTALPEKFDADLMAFNVGNGTLRFAKNDCGVDYVSFHPHARQDFITKIADVEYNPQSTCPIYDAFLRTVQSEAKIVRHLHAWGGLSLTALPLARISFWYGRGRNGKSTLIDTWAHVMGEYSQTIPVESFLDQGRGRRGGEASPDIASLPGVRCLRTSEVKKGAKLDESLVKMATGGEPMRARHLNRDFFEFRPAFKLTMQGNYKPNISGTDEGIWSRILVVPWTYKVPEAERDTLLGDKLKAEASGILNRLLDGLRDYLDNGLSPPDEVMLATSEYRDDSDPIGQFLEECTDRTYPEARVGGSEIYKVYKAWAGASGEYVASPKSFSRSLQDHGIAKVKSSGVWYVGLTLTQFAGAFEGLVYDDDSSRRR